MGIIIKCMIYVIECVSLFNSICVRLGHDDFDSHSKHLIDEMKE